MLVIVTSVKVQLLLAAFAASKMRVANFLFFPQKCRYSWGRFMIFFSSLLIINEEYVSLTVNSTCKMHTVSHFDKKISFGLENSFPPFVS